MPDSGHVTHGGAGEGLRADVTEKVTALQNTLLAAIPPHKLEARQAVRDLGAIAVLHAEQSRLDEKTQLPNMKGLEILYNRLLAEITSGREDRLRSSDAAVVLSIDIVDFGAYNPVLGWDRATDLLVAFARLLESNLRVGDIAARLGGDEFIVCSPVRLEELAERGLTIETFAEDLRLRIIELCDGYNARPDRIAVIALHIKAVVVTRDNPLGFRAMLRAADPKHQL